ncbi:hypothetical protein [Palleronia caenipelagi]|uniref:Uncharacterized protein n=1 Tax=Palleronia caenipelagi TaxID=2489174 RepID=A0A547PUL6_9RHOB|nr:hypothetical protein [Palleronia caenipelagi]TRD17835.1 hypothetical protein FEV53_12250 [Palleronia caenipelagi]
MYARSNRIGGPWSTVVIIAARDLQPDVALVSGSLQIGEATQFLRVETGLLTRFAWEIAEAPGEHRADVVAEPAETAPAGGETSMWTAFFVTDDGVTQTNPHVV